MPELPDITVYIERLDPLVTGRPVEKVELRHPFLLRTVDPPLAAVEGKVVRGLRRLGKRIVFTLDEELFLILHLMIAGRFHWRGPGENLARRDVLAVFRLPNGALYLTEAGTKRRAALHVVRGAGALRAHDPGGLEVLEADPAAFRERLTRASHTLKRALTDPSLISGIGNAYSDEILHRARLSPFQKTDRLSDEEGARLYESARSVLTEWIDRLRRDSAERFQENVTAFREEFAVHGRHRKPCPVCGAPVQRIVYAENECNYCPKCQTGGRLLADRSLSRLLKDDWPRTVEELELRHGGTR